MCIKIQKSYKNSDESAFVRIDYEYFSIFQKIYTKSLKVQNTGAIIKIKLT